MLTLEEAQQLVLTRLNARVRSIEEERTVERPFGWLFFLKQSSTTAQTEPIVERLIIENERKMRDRGFDAFGIAIEATHDAGLEFHACYRPAGFYFPPPQEFYNTGGFYERNLHLRMLDRSGVPQSRIAYSFPETRAFVARVTEARGDYRREYREELGL